MWFLLACTAPSPVVAPDPASAPVTAPETHSWKEEGQLVVEGLEQVKRLHRQAQDEAARVYAQRVYTERFEPRLEPALAKLRGEPERVRLEYAFGQLFAYVGAHSNKTVEHIGRLEQSVLALAGDAQRAFPPQGTPAAAVAPADESALRPIVPPAVPNWEKGMEPKPVMKAKEAPDR